MKKSAMYDSPKLVVFGSVSDLTLATLEGAYFDADYANQQLIPPNHKGEFPLNGSALVA